MKAKDYSTILPYSLYVRIRLLVAKEKYMQNAIIAIAKKSKMGCTRTCTSIQTSLYVHKEQVERWNVRV